MKTESSSASPNSSPAAQPASPSQSNASPQRKPRLALFIATACGLGYLPKAPGTWGSLGGVGVTLLIGVVWLRFWGWLLNGFFNDGITPLMHFGAIVFDSRLLPLTFAAIVIAVLGVWASGSVARFSQKHDPQFVVIDEVSGQLVTYVAAFAAADWKYLLLGFILFRVFDIWKPFPARQAESLPGGWGIMCDDWVAGIYAALGLWVARALGL
jgi:phosphatidylglycerophosphatase A